MNKGPVAQKKYNRTDIYRTLYVFNSTLKTIMFNISANSSNNSSVIYAYVKLTKCYAKTKKCRAFVLATTPQLFA